MSGILSSGGRELFRLGYEISPIILTNGIAGDFWIPIIQLTEGLNFLQNIVNGQVPTSLDDFFAHYRPLPGGKLASNKYGEYPFANQSVAANAAIRNPLAISMLMICPVRDPGGYITKLAAMSSLKYTLDQHVSLGGTFTVSTPAYIYTNCLLGDMTDVSTGESKQAQWQWQLDFTLPLITSAQAVQALSNLMQKMTNGLPSDGSLSGPGAQAGVAPAAANLSGASAPGGYGVYGGVGG